MKPSAPLQVNIVGGGVAGLCVARELLDQGIVPTLYDRGGPPGPHACSWWAGGMLAPYCEGESAEPAVVEMGKTAADWWQRRTGIVQRNGSLVLALQRDQADLRRFARLTRNHQEIDAAKISQLEPDLEGRFQRGLYFQDEAHLAPRQAIAKLRDTLAQDGVTFVSEEADPESLAKDSLCIDCRGISAKDKLSDLRGVKGEMLVLSCPDLQLHRPIRLLHPRIPLYIVPRGDGLYMLGATMIESSAKTRVTARSMLELLSSAYALNPAFGEAEIVEIGVDSRPAFPNNLPSVRQESRIIRANGLYRHGFLLAPSMAQQVATLVCEREATL